MELFKIFGKIVVNNSEANKDIDETTKKAEGSKNSLADGIKTAAKWGAAIVTAATAAAVAVGKVVNVAAEYETAFAKVSTLLDGSAEYLAKYKQQLLDASTETGIAASEMAEAVYSAISASVDQDSAIEFAKQAASLAKGGFTDTATAVDVLTTAINAYGMSVEDAGKISDMLINTQNLGKTTVDELASSMGKIIPTANAYGVQLETLAGSYAEITKNGIATAEATTYMNSMLNELGKSGTGASEVIKEKTGKSFKELMDSGVSLTEVLGILQEEADSTGKSMGDMFGSAEAAKAAMVLQNNAADLDDMIKSMGESAGTTEEAASKMADSAEAKFNKLKNTFSNLTIQVGSALLPVMTTLSDQIIENMPLIEDLAEELVPLLVYACEEILPPLLELAIEVLPHLIESLQVIIPAVEWVIDFLVESIKGVVGIVRSFLQTLLYMIEGFISLFSGDYEQAMTMFRKALDSWANMIKSILQSALGNMYKNVSGWVDKVLGAFTNFSYNSATTIGNAFGKIAATIRDVTANIFSTIKSTFGNAFDYMKGIVENMKNLFSFKWSVPKIALPHFKVTPNGWKIADLLKGTVPKLGVEWYAKGGILNNPTIFGMNGNNAMIGGESGAEAIAPISTLQSYVQEAVSSQNKVVVEAIDELISYLKSILPDMANTQIVLDSGALVGGIAPTMDATLGKLAMRSGRGVRS